MWNRVVGQIGQAWNQSQTDEQEDTGINGVSSTQSSGVEEAENLGILEQDSGSSKENELSSARAKYDTLHSKFKSLQSSYETDLQAERNVIEALKEQIMQTDNEQIEANKKADTKFSRLKQQARTRINELSKEIDALKLGQGADANTSITQEKMEVSLNISPSSSRASSPDRIQQELCEKEKELESVQYELTTLKQNNIELDSQLSQLQLQIAQLQPIKNELKTSLASFDRVELENTQLSNSLQDLTLKNSLLDSRINEVIEERKQSEENLDQFKKYKLKEFQEVIHNKSDEIEALNNSLSLLRIEYIDEKETRTKQDTQLSSLREGKELSRQRYQQLVLQVEGYTKEIDQLKTAEREREALKDNQELTNAATNSVDDLLQEVNNLKAELRDCREEIELKREDFLSKESELGNQKDELEDSLLTNDKLTNDVENYSKLLSEHTTKFEEMVSMNTELSDTINKLRKEVEDAEFAVNSSQTDLNASRDQLEREEHMATELQKQLSEANMRETVLQEQISQLKSDTAEHQNSTNILLDTDLEIEKESQLRQLKKENQALATHLEHTTSELADIKQANSSLSKVKQNLDEGMSILQLQVDTESKQIENLNNDKSNLEDQLVLQSEELASLKQQLALNCTELDNLNVLVKSLRDDNDTIRGHNSSVQSELEQIVDQLDNETNNNKRLTDQLDESARDLSLSQQNNATHIERISLLERELQEKQRLEVESLREASSSSERVEQQLTSAREECDQYQSKISELQLSIESLNREKKDIKSALDLATQSVNNIRLDLDLAKTSNNQLTADLDKVSSEKARLTYNLTSLQDELSQLRHQIERKDTELSSLLKTTETASSEINLLHQGVTSKEKECRTLKEQNIMLKEDAKRMQEGFDSALELIQNKLDRSDHRVSELEVSNRERESATNHIREERAITETQNTQFQEQLTVFRENQQNQIALQPENERLHKLTLEQSAQLNSTQNELERLQQENVVLRSSQENTLSGVQEQEVKSLQLSQDMSHLSRENEESYRKLSEVNRLLEEVEFERDQLKQENTNINESITQLQTLQIQHEQVVSELSTVRDHLYVERESWKTERAELVSQQSVEPLLATIPVSPERVEVPAATTYYIAQLEERLQNVGYTHGQELQRLRDTLEQEKLKSSQLEVALNKSSPSDGLPLPATATSEDFSCLNQSTLGDCVSVLRNQLMRWKANPKISMTRFLKSRPLPQLVLMAYFICLHILILFSIL